jgi:oligopeptide/dipeptide ABC transporter ATP-binding protein
MTQDVPSRHRAASRSRGEAASERGATAVRANRVGSNGADDAVGPRADRPRRIVECAARDALFAAPQHPYTKALLASVLTPEPGRGVPDSGPGLAFPNALAPPPGCVFHPRWPRCRVEPPSRHDTIGGFVRCHLHAGGVGLA